MNILILNWRDPHNPKAGGAEIVTHEHAKAWVKAGHTVTWFTSMFEGAKKREVVDGVVMVRNGSSFLTLLMAPFFYFQNKKQIDIVVDEIHGLPYFTPLYVKKPIVAFIHEVAGEIWDYMYPFPINKLGKQMEKWYFGLYKDVPFWTDAASTNKDLEMYGIPKGSALAIPCAISETQLLENISKEKNPTYIFVSRLVKMKGIEEVIRSFSEIHRQQKEAHLWIVGGGESQYVDELKDLSKKLGIDKRVTFFGRVSDCEKTKLMRKAHILLHASVKEGWGLVVLEAAAQETPAIVYDVQGLRDVVISQKTGIVLSQNTPQEMATQAIRLVADVATYKRFQKEARKRAVSFRWPSLTKQSLKLLNDAVKQK